jgi:hypothetical protein
MAVIKNEFLDGYTPVCNDCGVHLCWDISSIEYNERVEFWENWRCKDCKPFAELTFTCECGYQATVQSAKFEGTKHYDIFLDENDNELDECPGCDIPVTEWHELR